MSSVPKIIFYSGVGTVTGANFLLESPKGTRVLVDCGLVQGEDVAMDDNRKPFRYELSSISALLITHAHLDHVGRIPKLVKDGYSGPIYSTPETKALAELVLNDAVSVLGEEAKRKGIEPLYNTQDVQKVFPLWKSLAYHESFSVSEDVSIFLKDAGHILGSSMIEVTVKPPHAGPGNDGNVKVLFTGDLGNSPAPLLRDTEEVGDVDFMVMESVYGDKNHEDREGRANRLQRIIKDTVGRGGTLVIPAFSIDRTQVLLYELNNLTEKGNIPSVPIFVDSPMAIRATEIYRGAEDMFNDEVKKQIQRGDDIFQFPRLEYTMSSESSREIGKINGPKIILAGSGMSIGGRVIGHEGRYLPDPKNTILLVGYQTAGSLGRLLSSGVKKVNIYGQKIKVKAKIETLYGYSAHKDSDHLVEFVSTGTQKLKRVFVTMGELGSSMHLAQRLNDELGAGAIVPELGKDYDLFAILRSGLSS